MGEAVSDLPPPPPGFVLDSQTPATPATPAPPPGFVLDGPQVGAVGAPDNSGKIVAGGLVDMVKNLYSGKGRRIEGMPELNPDAFSRVEYPGQPPVGVSMGLMGLTGDPERQLEILRKQTGQPFPDKRDPYGNIIVTAPDGKEYYLNKPGASMADARDLAVQTLGIGGAAAGGAKIGQAILGGVGRVAGAGIGAGVGQAGLDLATNAAGGKQPFEPQRYLEAGVMGLLGEGGAMAVSPLFRKAVDVMIRPGMVDGAGNLTAAGAKAMTDAGIDPATATAEVRQALARLVNKTDDPALAARLAQAQGLPVPVNLSRGDVSRLPTSQGVEDAMLKGQMGQEAMFQARGFRQTQQEQLQANVPAIQERIGGGNVPTPGAGMAMVQDNLANQANAAKAGISQAYDAAREASPAFLGQQNVASLAGRFSNLANKEYMGAVPKAARAADDLAAVAQSAKGGKVDVTELEAWRRRVSKLRGATTDPAEGKALKEMVDGYDAFVDNAIDNALVMGDETTLKLWRKAVSLRSNFGRKFQSDALVSKIMEKAPDGSNTLALTPQESLNVVFTANGMGQKGSLQAVQKLRGLLGSDSREWGALKEEGFLRLLANQDAGGPRSFGLQRDFSGERFARNFDAAMKASPDLMRTLYSPQDLALMRQFRDVSLLATSRVPGALNESGTAGRGFLILRSLFGRGVVGNAVLGQTERITGWLGGATKRLKAEESLMNPLYRPPAGVGAGGIVSPGGLETKRAIAP